MPEFEDNSLTAAAAKDYMAMYQSTLRLLIASKALFKQLAETTPTPAERELYRSKAMDAQRKIDLLSSKLDAFVEGTVSIRPPTREEVAASRRLAQELADTWAKSGSAEAVVKLMTDAVASFDKLTVTG